jgi:hypothetical protein
VTLLKDKLIARRLSFGLCNVVYPTAKLLPPAGARFARQRCGRGGTAAQPRVAGFSGRGAPVDAPGLGVVAAARHDPPVQLREVRLGGRAVAWCAWLAPKASI